jgi:Na+/H+-dicarboxylate symporter
MIKRILLTLSVLAFGLTLAIVAVTGFGSVSIFGSLTAALLIVGTVTAFLGYLILDDCGPGHPCL